MDFIEQYLRFIKEAEWLKAVTRTAWTHDGGAKARLNIRGGWALFAGSPPDAFPA